MGPGLLLGKKKKDKKVMNEILIEPSGDVAYDHQVLMMIRNGLRKILPPGQFLEESFFLQAPHVALTRMHEGDIGVVCLVTKCQVGGERFFYEMISRWLLPSGKLMISSFVHHPFLGANRSFSFSEIRFRVESPWQWKLIQTHFPQLKEEIKLGTVSPYQAHRILEIKGLFSSEKNALIYETISSLVHIRPKDFDYDVFGQMQHFFVSCREEFKTIREHRHLSRMIFVAYLLRKHLKKLLEVDPSKRYVHLKLCRVRLHLPLEIKKVLGVFVGVSSLQAHELVEEKHLMKALKDLMPDIMFVEGSWFSSSYQEEKGKVLYLEIEKAGRKDFSSQELSDLKDRLPGALENTIETLMPALFMPRNEEEVLKNILMLSRELKYLKDLPQAFISFEEQSDRHLTFTIVLLRLLLSSQESSLQKLFAKASELIFIEDRVKIVGLLRKKYAKEATVFRLKVAKSPYLRGNRSIDLVRARQAIVQQMQHVLGDFRDYNGGMIAKQTENLEGFKKLLPLKGAWELESFFHALFPVEMRSVIPPYLLKFFYDAWEELIQRNLDCYEVVTQRKGETFLCFVAEKQRTLRQELADLVKRSFRGILFWSEKKGMCYLGLLFLRFDAKEEEQFMHLMQEWEKKSIKEEILYV